MMRIDRRRFAGLGAAMLGSSMLPVRAQDTKGPLRIIVPLPAGGVGDTSVRYFAEQWTATTKQTVVVDNRPGGSFMIGVQQLLNAPPDGNTWIQLSSGMTAAQAAFGRYDLTKQMTPISMMGTTPGAMFVHADSPLRNSKDLLEWIRLNPGKLNYGAITGGIEHLYTANLLKRYGYSGVLIPFKGGPDACTALAQKEIDVVLSALPLIIPFKGRIRPICIMTPQPSPMAPDVTTFLDQGLDVPELNYWGAFAVPVGTPAATITAHQKIITGIQGDATLSQKYAVQGMFAKPSSSEAMAQIIADEVKWMTPVAATLNLKAG